MGKKPAGKRTRSDRGPTRVIANALPEESERTRRGAGSSSSPPSHHRDRGDQIDLVGRVHQDQILLRIRASLGTLAIARSIAALTFVWYSTRSIPSTGAATG